MNGLQSLDRAREDFAFDPIAIPGETKNLFACWYQQINLFFLNDTIDRFDIGC